MKSNSLVLQNNSLNEEKGYKMTFLTGEMRGHFFWIRPGDRLTIGRSQNCNVVINDTKASREHAELVWFEGEIVVTDLKSQNGVIVNDQKVLQKPLELGDRLIIGKTIIKVSEDDFRENLVEDKFQENEGNRESSHRSGSKIFLIVIICAIIWVLIDEKKDPVQREISSVESGGLSGDSEGVIQKIEKRERRKNKKLDRKVANVLQRGLRELREKNHFRAIAEFNHALDLKPQDAQANFYLRKAKDELDKEIQRMSIDAQTDIESLKYKKALVSYCGIIRLLHNYPGDQRYKDAKNNIEKLEKKLDYEQGEVICLQE